LEVVFNNLQEGAKVTSAVLPPLPFGASDEVKLPLQEGEIFMS
jgi:hypothetical protein